ncbi:hypothetical protein V6N13_033974 [Hibiscus sabdariffa]
MVVDRQPGTEPKARLELPLVSDAAVGTAPVVISVPWQLWCRHSSHHGAGMVGWQPQGAVIGRGGQLCRHAGIQDHGGAASQGLAIWNHQQYWAIWALLEPTKKTM